MSMLSIRQRFGDANAEEKPMLMIKESREKQED
jgi:hypothetical protein